MRRIAVAMIVKNEESCIAKCLDSLMDFEAVYILDTGSEDKTCDVARRYANVTVFENEYKWEDSFCKARNYIKNKCDAEWIFSIDADNVLEPGGYDKIQNAIDDAGRREIKTVDVILEHEKSGDWHYFPSIYKKSCEWKGNVHNHLDIVEQNRSTVRIKYGYSEAHKKDPDRALRMLLKEVHDTSQPREMYYLAREYYYRHSYKEALEWYQKYVQISKFQQEIADAFIMMARCYYGLKEFGNARYACLSAININADFKEALEFMADLVGPINSEKWLYWAYHAKNQDILFVRTHREEKSDYYDAYIPKDDCSRYQQIYEYTAARIGTQPVLDCGCGTAQLSKLVSYPYEGVDFSKEAIKNAVSPNVSVMNLYNEPIMTHLYKKYPVITFLEVLEHVDDLEILKYIPSGKQVIFSVPSFGGRGHLRRYTEKIIRERYRDLLNILEVYRFNMKDGKWNLQAPMTNNHITLIRSIKQ